MPHPPSRVVVAAATAAAASAAIDRASTQPRSVLFLSVTRGRLVHVVAGAFAKPKRGFIPLPLLRFWWLAVILYRRTAAAAVVCFCFSLGAFFRGVVLRCAGRVHRQSEGDHGRAAALAEVSRRVQDGGLRQDGKP